MEDLRKALGVMADAGWRTSNIKMDKSSEILKFVISRTDGKGHWQGADVTVFFKREPGSITDYTIAFQTGSSPEMGFTVKDLDMIEDAILHMRRVHMNKLVPVEEVLNGTYTNAS